MSDDELWGGLSQEGMTDPDIQLCLDVARVMGFEILDQNRYGSGAVMWPGKLPWRFNPLRCTYGRCFLHDWVRKQGCRINYVEGGVLLFWDGGDAAGFAPDDARALCKAVLAMGRASGCPARVPS